MIDIVRLDKHKEYENICKNVYEESFPAYERKDFDTMMKIQYEKRFDVYAIVDDNKAIGIYVPWTFDNYIYIEFIAIDKKYRGHNYGSICLEHILEKADKYIVIEVEPPELSDIAKKRIAWYKRFGFIMNNEKYVMPALDNLEDLRFVDMKIMTTKQITNKEFEDIKNTLHKNVYDL